MKINIQFKMQEEIKGSEKVEPKDEMKLDWMYKAETVEREDYLLGRSVDKAFDQFEKSTGGKINVDRESIPSSIFTNPSVVTQVDIARKVHEDPLFAIKKKEMETREQLLKNPRKLKQLHEMIKNQKMAVEQKKKKKKKKHKDGKDLDALLALKYKKLKDKLDLKDLKEIESSNSDSDSGDSFTKRTKKKGKKDRVKKELSSTERSDCESDHKLVKKSKNEEKRYSYDKKKKQHSKQKRNERLDLVIDPDLRNNKHMTNKDEKNWNRNNPLSINQVISDFRPKSVSSISRERKREPSEDGDKKRQFKEKSNFMNKYNSSTSRERKRETSEDREKSKHMRRKRSYSSSESDNETNKDRLRKKETTNVTNREKNRKNSDNSKHSRNKKNSSFAESDDERNKFSSKESNYFKKLDKYSKGYDKDQVRKQKRSINTSHSPSEREDDAEYCSKQNNEFECSRKKENPRVKSKDPKKNNIKTKNDSDQEIINKKRKVKKGRDSSNEDFEKTKTSNNKTRNKDKKKSKSSSSSSSESMSDDERKTKKTYGLVLPAGYVAKPQSHQKVIQTKVEDTKPWKKPKNKKLCAEEIEKKIAEMMQNAQWRDKEREKKITDYKTNQAKEKKENSKYSTDFLRKQMLYAASQSTIEQRIKSNINNIQRNNSDMDRNFARR